MVIIKNSSIRIIYRFSNNSYDNNSYVKKVITVHLYKIYLCESFLYGP